MIVFTTRYARSSELRAVYLKIQRYHLTNSTFKISGHCGINVKAVFNIFPFIYFHYIALLLALSIGASKATRAQTLSCYECAAKPGNNTCTSEFRQTIQSLGFDKRCRIMEMNGRLVSTGIFRKKLCTQTALSNVSRLQPTPHMTAHNNTQRCQIKEMNVRLVCAGNVPAKICTQDALSKIRADRKLS